MDQKTLIKLIDKLVESHVKKEFKKLRVQLIKEVDSRMEKYLLEEQVDNYDDDVLNSVLKGRRSRDISRKSVHLASGTKEDLRRRFMEAQEQFDVEDEEMMLNEQPKQGRNSAYSEYLNESEYASQPVPLSAIPKNLQKVLNRNYSPLIKKFDEK